MNEINFEMCVSKGFEGVRTGVRSVVISGRKQDIPHIIPLLDEGDKSELLVTIAGRQPLYLRCRHEGHFRRECSTPFCRHCAQFGHLTETCAAAGSYASALREVTREKQAESVNIEEMDVEGVNAAEVKGEGVEGEGNVNVSGGGDEVGETAAGTAAQLASPAVESAVTTSEQPVVVKKSVGKGKKGKKGKKVWLEAARELERVDEERKAEVARKVECDKEREDKKDEEGERVTLGSEFQPLQESWASLSCSDSGSEGESSGDEIPQWTEVRRKRGKRKREVALSVSPPPPSIAPASGKPQVVNENTEATSGAFKKKRGSADARGEEE